MDLIPTVSVVIPCYNAAVSIAETLATISAQTIRDIEILVVDDGSKDDSCGIVERAAAADPRIRLIRQPNAGVSVARNTGISAARAAIIALMDADDRWAPTHLATHLARFAADAKLGVSSSPTRFIDTAGKPTGLARPKLSGLTPLDFLIGNPTTTCSAIVARRAVFDDAGLFNAELRRARRRVPVHLRLRVKVE